MRGGAGRRRRDDGASVRAGLVRRRACGDLIEHLRNPGAFLARVRPLLRAEGQLVLTTPNVANWAMRLGLLAGRWRYTERGILDRTHTHLFTRSTLMETLERAGYRVGQARLHRAAPGGSIPTIERVAHAVEPAPFALRVPVRRRGRAGVISVVIPVKDGGADLVRCLDAICRRWSTPRSRSWSSTPARATAAPARALPGARVHEIPPSEFGHGRTRNLGAELAQGEILVFTSQDAFAADETWLATLALPPGRDESRALRPAAAARGRHSARALLPRLPLRARGARATARRETSRTSRQTLFSNVNSAIPRAVWREFPFADDLIMSEDQEWSRRVLRAGYELVYEPRPPSTTRTAIRSPRHSGASSTRVSRRSGRTRRTRADRGALRRAGARYARGEVEWLWETGQRRWIPYAAAYELAKFTGMQLGRRHRAPAAPAETPVQRALGLLGRGGELKTTSAAFSDEVPRAAPRDRGCTRRSHT